MNADFVTYPTQVEGFGNQFVEAVFFKKPVILTPYPVYKADIGPLGFKNIEMPHRVTNKVLGEVNKLIDDIGEKKKMVDHNFELGKKYFSYEATAKKLAKVFRQMKLQ